MSIRLAILAFSIGCMGLVQREARAQDQHPVGNPAGKAWQVEYDELSPSDDGDLAVRLVIAPVSNDPTTTGNKVKLTAKLYRFDKLNVAKTKYKKRDGDAGTVDLKGSVASAPGNTTHLKKSASIFVLSGTYYDDEDNLVIVTVREKYHPGKKNKKTAGARVDDVVTFAITEKKINVSPSIALVTQEADPLDDQSKATDYARVSNIFETLAGGAGTVPCDETPPADAAAEAPCPADPTDFDYTPAEP